MPKRSISPHAPPLSIAALALASATACGSGTPPGAACNPCDPGNGLAVITGHQTNPDGVSYPSPPGGYGRLARSGRTPGSVIANLKFWGYPNGDASKGLKVVALADHYDPCGKRLKVLHLSVAGVWCTPCNKETAALAAATALLQSQGVVVVQALSDGSNQGVGATQQDLDYWVKRYSLKFTELLDPGPTNFGGFFNASAIPWNADIDPRTMEIIDSSTGWPNDVMTAIQPGVDAVKNPPLYPIAPAAACTDQ
jgi:hypothetical protein